MANFRSSAAMLRFFGVTACGVATDLAVKAWAFGALVAAIVTTPDGAVRVYPLRSVQLLPGWLHIDVTANQGAVFGFGQGQRALFLFASVVAIAFLSFLFATSGNRRGYQILLGLLLAGVLGNMYDRVVFGYVRDMIHALPGKNWPPSIEHILPRRWRHNEVFPWVFNIADSLLCIGVGLMLLSSFFENPRSAAPAGVASAGENEPSPQRESSGQ